MTALSARDVVATGGRGSVGPGAAWAAFGVSAASTVATMVLLAFNRSAVLPRSFGDQAVLQDAGLAVAFAPWALVGALITSRRPGNRIGWLFLLGGAAISVGQFGREYAIHTLYGSPGSLPAAAWAAWLSEWSVLGITVIILLPLTFPTGRLMSRRWIPVAALALTGGVLLTAGFLFAPGNLSDFTGVRNPAGIPGLRWLNGDTNPAWVLFLPAAVGALAALVVRFRRSRGDERAQLKWFATAAGVMLAGFLLFSMAANGRPSTLQFLPFLVGIAGIPVAAGFAILKYRLYDIDLVIRKTVVFAILAAFAGLVYAVGVFGVGRVVSSRARGLSFVAGVVAALAFQPLRRFASRLGNRLVFGRRATPYEVLSQFSERVAGTYSSDDVLAQMARALAGGTGAATARVWLRLGNEIGVESSWPEGEAAAPVAVVDDHAAAFPAGDFGVEVRHQGELLGALSVAMPPSEPMNPSKEKLVRDLASQAGLVLRNVRLIEDLRASRRRIVAAQDEERRRLERNIHDGAQQQLVALSVKLRLAEQLAGRDLPKARDMLTQLQTETAEALENLRDLARGIYPPLLADQGLPAALRSQARKSAVPVSLEAEGIGRFPQDVEAAVYFCALEALQNVAKYAEATTASVRLAATDGVLSFEVRDDGRGFEPASTGYGTGLQGMADRLAALSGELTVTSAPGAGTTVRGVVPARTSTA